MGISKKMRKKLGRMGGKFGLDRGGDFTEKVSDKRFENESVSAEEWLTRELEVAGVCGYCGKEASHLETSGIFGDSEVADAVKVNFEDGSRAPILVHIDCMDEWDKKQRKMR